MDKKTEAMVALGAAIGANCIPCFDYLYAKAKEADLPEEDIAMVIETAFRVKNGAQAFLRSAIQDTTGQAPEDTRETCCAAAAGGCC